MINFNLSKYPLVLQHFRNPQNVGNVALTTPNYHTVQLGSLERGSVLHWQVCIVDQTIVQVCYRVYGCAFQIASCSWLSEYLLNQSVTVLSQPISNQLIKALALPAEKWHCAYLCEDACHQLL